MVDRRRPRRICESPLFVNCTKQIEGMINYLTTAAHKLLQALQCVQGWIVALCVFIANYFSGHRVIVILVVTVTIMDAFWGLCLAPLKSLGCLKVTLRIHQSGR